MLKTIIMVLLLIGVGGFSSAAPIRASFYAAKFEGRKTANGKVYHAHRITAASLAYPLNTIVHVTNLENGKSLFIPVTDRGPYSNRYSLDLSIAAARALGITQRAGWGWVEITRDDILTQPDYSIDNVEVTSD